LLLTFAVAVMPAPPISSQTTRPEDLPKWEAISIKPCAPNSPTNASFSPGRLTLECQNVWFLIQAAYVLWAKNGAAAFPGAIQIPIEGGPDWIKSAQYTITAKAVEAVKPGVMQGPMLQALFEDRFRVRTHWENRDVPIYALTVARVGPKLQFFKEGTCTRPDVDAHNGPRRPTQPAPGQRLCAGGNRRSEQNPVNMRFDAEGISLDQFSRMLALDRPVVNRTGITGLFNFHLEYANPTLTAEAKQADVAVGPSIFTVIEQLGLKLESSRGPGRFLVIDSVQRPSEN
jgi:uncharacterized protein (TIGR03435 family)